MSLVKSKELALGSVLREFSLSDACEKVYNSRELLGKTGLIIAVMCNHCPYSNAIWSRLIKVAEFAKKLDVNTVAINPNIHPNYPEDSPAHMLDKQKEFGFDFPYLIDAEQAVAHSLKATCTPEIFLFDKEAKLFYHGRVDDNWHDERSVKSEDLREALIALFGEQKPPLPQYSSLGCSIKWLNTVLGD
ncbi:MAG: thioredoxin family protein [Sulfurospirillum sp.]|nr:thioredoxin family protein [Sulfurospirillum sp.]